MHQLDWQFNTSPLERIWKNMVFNGCLLMVAMKHNHTVFRKLFWFHTHKNLQQFAETFFDCPRLFYEERYHHHLHSNLTLSEITFVASLNSRRSINLDLDKSNIWAGELQVQQDMVTRNIETSQKDKFWFRFLYT